MFISACRTSNMAAEEGIKRGTPHVNDIGVIDRLWLTSSANQSKSVKTTRSSVLSNPPNLIPSPDLIRKHYNIKSCCPSYLHIAWYFDSLHYFSTYVYVYPKK